jgi:hypothetical protein
MHIPSSFEDARRIALEEVACKLGIAVAFFWRYSVRLTRQKSFKPVLGFHVVQ